MHERALKIGLHLIGWAVIFTLPMIFLPRMQQSMYDIFVKDFIPQVILVGYFYLNAYILVPRYLARRKFVLFALATLALACVYLYCCGNFQPPEAFFGPPRLPHPGHFTPHPGPRFFVPLLPVVLFLLVFTMSTGITVLEELFTTQNKRKQAEVERSRAELSTLKAQINPHFLFNTLNSIYSLALEKSDRTADAIVKLSGLMRYVLTESEAEFINLETEIEYINQYIELQKLRLSDKTSIHFETRGDFRGKTIAPLLLTPFVENAFKYGVSTHDSSGIKIFIGVEGNSILFTVENRIVATNVENTTKHGIENVRQRLELVYPGRHTINILNHEGTFTVNLKIDTNHEATLHSDRR